MYFRVIIQKLNMRNYRRKWGKIQISEYHYFDSGKFKSDKNWIQPQL